MEKFSEDQKCPKCGGCYFSVTWKPLSKYLEVECNRCHYSWIVKALDSKEEVDVKD